MWFIFPIIAVGAAGLTYLYNSISEEEKQAEKLWKTKYEEVERTLDEHNSNIQDYLAKINNIYNYYEMVDYHYSSVQLANVAYSLMRNSKTSLQGINNLIKNTNEHRNVLQEEIKIAKKQGNHLIFSEKIEEQKILNIIRKDQFEQREVIKKQIDEFYEKLQQLNYQTSEIKNEIRINCGQKGFDWYQRLESRKREKVS